MKKIVLIAAAVVGLSIITPALAQQAEPTFTLTLPGSQIDQIYNAVGAAYGTLGGATLQATIRAQVTEQNAKREAAAKAAAEKKADAPK